MEITTHAPPEVAPSFLAEAEFIELSGKRPIAKKWTTDTSVRFGAVEAYGLIAGGKNVGVVVAADQVVVDIDPRNGGDVSWERLKADLSIDATGYPTVRTGSGGLHVYMRLPAGEGRLKNDLGADGYPGVELKCVGRQVVAPGSIHPETGEPYTVLKDLDPLDDDLGIPLAPAALLVIGSKPAAASHDIQPGRKSAEWLASTLELLDPTAYRGDHASWLELMMACHHATGGAGGEEFALWSAGDPEYAEKYHENLRRWSSLNAAAQGGVTVGTLYKHLEKAGVNTAAEPDFDEASQDFADVDPLDEPCLPDMVDRTKAKRQASALKARRAKSVKVAELKRLEAASSEAFAKLVNETYVYDRSNGKRVNIATGEALDDQVFENIVGPGWARSGGKGSIVNAIKTGKSGLDMRSVMMAAAFPGKDRLVEIDMGTHRDEALNTWYDTTLEPVAGDHSWFRAEVERMFPDTLQQEIMLDYWAARCLEPGRKIRWQLVIESAQGVGKGLMKSGMTTLLGWRNVGNFGVTQMLDKFNSWMVSSSNLFGEEIGFGTWKEAKEAYENMKAPIADDHIAVRPMQRESMVRVPNGSNYIVHRNPGRKFFCAEDDRRICYLQPQPDGLDDKGVHFQRLASHYGSAEDMAAVRHWLMNDWAKGRVAMEEAGGRLAGVGHVRFDSDPPMTPAKRELMRECLRADKNDALDFADLDRLLSGSEVFSAEDVVQLVRDAGLEYYESTDKQLLVAVRKWLNAAGYVKHKRNTNGQGVTLYSPEGDTKWSAMGPAARERAYLQMA